MPTDPQTIHYDNEELVEVLNEVEKIMDTAEYDDVAWMGDLNWDRNRNSGFAQTMETFIARLNLCDVWENFPVNYTHIHTDYKSVSTIDRILVNERLLQFIVEAGVVHLADNPSRHSPIMMKLEVGNIPPNVQSKLKLPRHPAWYKASEENIEDYTGTLDIKLRALQVPASLNCQNPNCKRKEHSKERDDYMLDILSVIIETSYTSIPLTSGGRRKWDPDQNCPVGKVIPGWQEHVEPFRQESIFWYGVWQSAGSPHTGHLHSIMKWTQNKYHYAVRKIKKKLMK